MDRKTISWLVVAAAVGPFAGFFASTALVGFPSAEVLTNLLGAIGSISASIVALYLSRKAGEEAKLQKREHWSMAAAEGLADVAHLHAKLLRFKRDFVIADQSHGVNVLNFFHDVLAMRKLGVYEVRGSDWFRRSSPAVKLNYADFLGLLSDFLDHIQKSRDGFQSGSCGKPNPDRVLATMGEHIERFSEFESVLGREARAFKHESLSAVMRPGP